MVHDDIVFCEFSWWGDLFHRNQICFILQIDYTYRWNAKAITVKFDYQEDKKTPFMQNNETANHKLSYSVIRC